MINTVGIQYRRSARVGKNSRANVSMSGVSLSRKAGPVTVNSRGRASIRLAPGWSFRLGKGTTGNAALVMLALSLVVLVVWLAWAAVRLVFVCTAALVRFVVGLVQSRSRGNISQIP